MPQIREYQSRTEVPGPFAGRRATAEDAGGGQGLVTIGNAVVQTGEFLQKRKEQAEVSDLTAKLSTAKADFTTHFKETLRTAKPGDDTIADNFVKGYDEYVGKISDGISTRAGRQHFDEMNAQLRGHFSEMALSGQADLAGIKAKEDYTTGVNALSNSLLDDPSSFALAQKMHETGLQELQKNGLSTAAATELKTQGMSSLAKAAVRGWIKNNPDTAEAQLKAGSWDGFFSGDVKAQLLGEVKIAKNAEESEKRKQEEDRKRILKEQQERTQGEFLKKLVNNQLRPKDILASNLDPFGSGSQEQFLQLIEKKRDSGIKTDPATFIRLWDNVHRKDGDPKKIIDENSLNSFVGRGLTLEDMMKLRNEIQGKRTTQGQMEATFKERLFVEAKAVLNPKAAIGIPDPDGEEHVTQYMYFVTEEIEKQKQAGKPVSDLLNPKSPEWLGHHIERFTRPLPEILKSMGDRLRGSQGQGGAPAAPPKNPRLPNESPADYLKRIGK